MTFSKFLVCPVRMHFPCSKGNSNRQRHPLVRSHASRAYFMGSSVGTSRESHPVTASSCVPSTGCCHSSTGTSLQAQSNDSIQTTMGGTQESDELEMDVALVGWIPLSYRGEKTSGDQNLSSVKKKTSIPFCAFSLECGLISGRQTRTGKHILGPTSLRRNRKQQKKNLGTFIQSKTSTKELQDS